MRQKEKRKKKKEKRKRKRKKPKEWIILKRAGNWREQGREVRVGNRKGSIKQSQEWNLADFICLVFGFWFLVFGFWFWFLVFVCVWDFEMKKEQKGEHLI